MKKIIIIIVAVIVLVMMAATIIEKTQGTQFVGDNIYGSWWFSLLWAILAISGIVYTISMKLYKRVPIMLLHASFIVILVGALCTHLTQKHGQIHLRQAAISNTLELDNGTKEKLPFMLQLKSFRVDYYPGTDAPEDYVSIVNVKDNVQGNIVDEMQVSMNNIGEYSGYRFCQAGYDSDGLGTILSVQYDPWGIGITYTGYLLLLISVIWTLLSKHSRIRQLYKTALSLVFVLTLALPANAEPKTLPSDMADDFGHICILYNNRICPANTVATVFTTKLTGKSTWDGMSANEVFTGWTFFFDYWCDVPMIKIKDHEAQHVLGINSEWASYNDFWDKYNKYKLEQPLKEANARGDIETVKHLREADEKFNMITMFFHGELLRMYPYPVKEKGQGTHIKWFTPGDEHLPLNIPEKEWFFLRKSLDYLSMAIVTGDNAKAETIIGKIRDYQHLRAPEVVPSNAIIDTEIVYNTLNTQRWPIFLALTISLLFVILYIRGMGRKSILAEMVFTVILMLWTTAILTLRWIISGHLPLSNGYETMQFMAWATLLLTLILQHKIGIMRMCGPLLASLCLLVAMLSEASPQVSQLMPVLQSPLLSIHVMIIMFSYVLLAVTCIIAFVALIKIYKKQNTTKETALSQLMLYPAVMCLTVGIFIGAVWANVSWGRYWSWDSKETWALITMLVYAAPLHSSLKWLQKERNYHLYVLLAFLTVLMTYFGVNYYLSGMHSYA